jgi:integrase
MARPSKTAGIDYKLAHDLTTGLLERAACPDGVPFVLLKDSDKTGLRLRVTKAGGKHWQFETRVKGKLFTRALGEWDTVSIAKAREEAHRLRGLTERGTDPRVLERQQEQAEAAAIEAQATEQRQQAKEHAANALTVGEAWSRYTAERRPFWGDLTIRDHDAMVQAGGIERERRPGVLTKAGPLAEMMALRLVDLTAPTIDAWAKKEAKDRPARVRSALRLLKAFLRWAASEPDLKGKADPTAASSKKAREVAGKAKPKNDYLQREQLPAWFAHVRQIQNPVISAYLQCLLLTGARREELAALRWEDVNFQWHGMDLKDKIEGRRAVPLTPYVESLITALPRRNEWVFSSAQTLDLNEKNSERRARYHASKGQTAPEGAIATRSASGRLVEPSIAHRRACAAAGLELTLHGLRRSFASLCEWLDIPGGISAQIQGHAPQGVREQNYIRRPLDLLRVHHEKIEAWILEQAGVTFDASAGPGKLQLVG